MASPFGEVKSNPRYSSRLNSIVISMMAISPSQRPDPCKLSSPSAALRSD
jgi:hypothetical protein